MPAWRQWRNALLGTLLVVSGLATALVTSAARQSGQWELARAGAIASLVFVALLMIFVVPPLLRAARAEVAGYDAPVRVTSGGVIFVSIFLVVGFAAYNTANNLLFLLFSVLASALFVGWAAGRASLRDLVVSARYPDHLFAGESAPVLVSLHNRKRLLPSFSILVEARTRVSDAEESGKGARRRRPSRRARDLKLALAYFVHVSHQATMQQRVEQTFTKRGRFLVTGFELSTGFPFGFFRLRRRLHGARDVELIIYPKLEPAGDELHLLPMNAGQLLSARRGAGHDLYGLRDYQTQDDVRHVDWKATARTRRLTVREFTAEDERRVHLVFDTRQPPTHPDEANAPSDDFDARFERGVTLAAALAAHFVDERAEVRLTLGHEAGTYGTGREHLYLMLRRLAVVAPSAPGYDDAIGADVWTDNAAATPDANYVILLTAATPGSLPAHLWRRAHVINL